MYNMGSLTIANQWHLLSSNWSEIVCGYS
uniref:Uncharacterized protein n=1 Tax=Anguilla anguilla TaxID=7936 RepID=A0A0E9QU41_ANGAN